MDYQSSGPVQNDWTKTWGGFGAGPYYNRSLNLYNTFNPLTRRLNTATGSQQRRVARHQFRHAVRTRDEYSERSARDRQYLQQDLYGRGLGNSSIATEDQAMFERSRERALADMNEQVKIARNQQQLVDYGIRAQRQNMYMGYLDNFLGLAGGIMGMGGGSQTYQL